MLTFNKNYFAFAVLVFLIETLIALYVHDDFIRPYLGDVLVVILIYCFLKSFVRIPVLTASISVLLFSFTIEFLQFLNIVEKLSLQDSKLARTVIGTSFSWIDLLTYIAGIVIVIGTEKYGFKKEIKTVAGGI
ncbi:MAG TPA: DUF2809 domain-containing protein [Flavobacterium sp.]|uniref:ribosomal maturation YjgA family protein n=1 Tax=Flavobacterium sp. TaxID=239 RepID=UPI002C48C5C7|nr:DUF2809 domain-containing protein [Flavobacterium sp.]HSD15590.1 DUF2809 domain-containing protein [Flavobacterium sp.]